MNTWPVQDAKARFSELLTACLTDGPQMVTKRGTEIAVLVPLREWRRLQSTERPPLKQLLLQADVRTTQLVPPRQQSKRRKAESLT